ncbi:hypothetical protein L484_021585 [Morus notabilis]|uniref:26S proteasome non-ATPase regulatory subunit 1/RPN2 N-terminal domain-containing protein n=1 Tax=Morus notabilis TaxID=981085 RepID=W9S8H2_9ROSA|nr:hypothetical protein L484_021585 [Morus notabilis]
MAATMVSSAGGLLAMLNETHPSLKLHALSNLNNLVDNFWPEISTSVPVMDWDFKLAMRFLDSDERNWGELKQSRFF